MNGRGEQENKVLDGPWEEPELSWRQFVYSFVLGVVFGASLMLSFGCDDDSESLHQWSTDQVVDGGADDR
jgi:hypothetical protein